MTRIPINMPKMSMTMTEGTVVEWLVAVGDRVASGDALVIVTTDKVDMDVESAGAGALTEMAHAESPKGVRSVVKKVLRVREEPTALCTHRPVLPTIMEVVSQYAPGRLLRSVPDRDPWLKTGEILVVHMARRPRGKIRAVAIEKQRPVLSEGR